MSNAVHCSGCAAALAVPPGAAGKVLRCPRCGVLNPIPAEPESEPEPPPRVRAERARPARDDRDDDPPPRRRKAGVPGWAWGVGAGCVAVAVLVAVGLMLGRRARERDAQPYQPPREQLAEQGMLPETWERRTDEANGLAWEFPHTGQTTPTSAAVRFQDQSALGFDVTVIDVAKKKQSIPLYNPLAALRRVKVGDPCDWGKVETVGTLDGRPAVVARAQIAVTLVAADAEKVYEFRVTHPVRDEGEKRVKRFFDSARITRPPPAEPIPKPGP